MSRMVVLFRSTHDAIRAERLCLSQNLACNAIAVPRTISSNCGIALEIKEDLLADISAILTENSIPFSQRELP